MTLGFHVATDHCYGCKTCTVACASEQQLDPGVLLRRVTADSTGSNSAGHRLRLDGLQPLRRACLCVAELPGRGLQQAGRRYLVIQDHSRVHRLQDLHRGVPVPVRPAYDEVAAHHLQVRRLLSIGASAASCLRVRRGVPRARTSGPGRVRNGAFRACRRRFGQGRLGDASEPGGDARPRHHGGGGSPTSRRHVAENGRPRRGGLLARARSAAAPVRRRRSMRRCGVQRGRGGSCCTLLGETSCGAWDRSTRDGPHHSGGHVFVVAASVAGRRLARAQTVSLSRERLGADVMVLPVGASSSASEVLFTAPSQSTCTCLTTTGSAVAGMDGVAQATPQFFTQTVNESCCSVVGVDARRGHRRGDRLRR